MGGQIVQRDAFTAIGLKWEGTYRQAGQGLVRPTHDAMEARQHEVAHRVAPYNILGVSYNREEDFTYYLCVAVSQVESVPEGMAVVTVPAHRYAAFHKRPDIGVSEAYDAVFAYMRENGLQQAEGPLSIVEIHQPKRDQERLDFTIMIPIR